MNNIYNSTQFATQAAQLDTLPANVRAGLVQALTPVHDMIRLKDRGVEHGYNARVAEDDWVATVVTGEYLEGMRMGATPELDGLAEVVERFAKEYDLTPVLVDYHADGTKVGIDVQFEGFHLERIPANEF